VHSRPTCAVSSVPDKKELIKTLSVTASKAIGKPEQVMTYS